MRSWGLHHDSLERKTNFLYLGRGAPSAGLVLEPATTDKLLILLSLPTSLNRLMGGGGVSL